MGKLNPHIRLKCFSARVRCATTTGEEEQAIDHCVTGQDGAAELVLSWSVPSLRKPSCISQMSFLMKDKVCIHLQVRSIRRFTCLASESQWSDSSSPASSVLAPAVDLPNIKHKMHSKAPSWCPLSSHIHLGHGTSCHPQSHGKCDTGAWPKGAADSGSMSLKSA